MDYLREVNVLETIAQDPSADALAAGAGTETFAREDEFFFAPLVGVAE